MIGQALASPSGRGTDSAVTAQMVLDHVMRTTGASVRLNDTGDLSLHIWGESNHVLAARNLLQSMLSQCDREMVYKREGLWRKAQPHWEDRERYEQTKRDQEILLKRLRREPEMTDSDLKTLIFLWPPSSQTMAQGLGEELEKLDSIRMDFKVHVYASIENDYCIYVAGPKEGDLGQIVARLRVLANEVIARFTARLKTFLVEPPSHTHELGNILLHFSPYGAEASLFGGTSPGQSANYWTDVKQRIKDSNKNILQDRVEEALSRAHCFGDNARMRVHFGYFVLDSVKRPKNDIVGYEFEEFRHMLLLDGTKGRLIPRLGLDWPELLERCSHADKLLESLDPGKSLASLGRMEPKYSVSFEFSDPHAHLRLETDFKKVPGSREIEATNHRLFRIRRGNEQRTRNMAMQVSTLDFERCDWQVDLEHFEPLNPSTANLGPELESLPAAVAFNMHLTPAQREFGAWPVKKTLFPQECAVSRLIEKSALQLRVKGTSYILELIRFDEYKNRPTLRGLQSNCSFATWGATLFDTRWTSVPRGESRLQDQRYQRLGGGIQAFFPAKSGEQTAGREGFSEFMEIVNKVSELLGCPRNAADWHADQAEGVAELLRADFGTLF